MRASGDLPEHLWFYGCLKENFHGVGREQIVFEVIDEKYRARADFVDYLNCYNTVEVDT